MSEEWDRAWLVNTAWPHVHEAWRNHPELERMEELLREFDADGKKTWRTMYIEHDDGLIEYVCQPLDPRDPRPQILIGAWPLQFFIDERR